MSHYGNYKTDKMTLIEASRKLSESKSKLWHNIIYHTWYGFAVRWGVDKLSKAL